MAGVKGWSTGVLSAIVDTIAPGKQCVRALKQRTDLIMESLEYYFYHFYHFIHSLRITYLVGTYFISIHAAKLHGAYCCILLYIVYTYDPLLSFTFTLLPPLYCNYCTVISLGINKASWNIQKLILLKWSSVLVVEHGLSQPTSICM